MFVSLLNRLLDSLYPGLVLLFPGEEVPIQSLDESDGGSEAYASRNAVMVTKLVIRWN